MTFKDILKSIKTNQKPVTTKFLDPKEQRMIHNYFRSDEYHLIGGYDEAERKRASFYQAVDSDVIGIKITTDSDYLTLTHQNILGSLMGLSITRDSIGDILPKQGVFFITKEVYPIIETTFTKIGNHPIQLEIYNGTVQSELNYEENTVSISSMRLDLVVSKISHISRKKAAIWIQNEYIKLNHEITTKITKTTAINDVLSIRKQGRFIILDDSKRSKKGNIIVKYGKII